MSLILSKAQTLGNMASFLNSRLITEYAHVRKEARFQTIEIYRKAINFFLESNELESEVDDIITNMVQNHCKIGIEYGKLRQWQKAHGELKISINLLLQKRALLSFGVFESLGATLVESVPRKRIPMFI